MRNSKGIVGFVKRAIRENKDKRATTATVVMVDGNLADIRLEGHATNLANCRITGDPSTIRVGMLVSITWEEYNGTLRPVVQGAGSAGIDLTAPGTGTVLTDNTTIEYSGNALRVKPGGIGIEHLNFAIGTDIGIGDILPGWSVTEDGILRNNELSLSPYGEITLGTSPDIVKISTVDSSYRIFAGHATPASAPFSVSKTGHLISSSATIAGWTINTTEIKKTGIILDSVDDTIYVGSGTPRIVIDGDEKLIKSSNFDAFKGWQIDGEGDAVFNNVKVRGTIYASIFEYGTVQSTAGTLAVGKSAGVVYADFTTPAYYYYESGTSSVNFNVEDDKQGNARTSVGDVVHIKELTSTGVNNAYLFITAVANYTGYHTCTGTLMYGSKSTEFTKGGGFLIYGQHGDGTIFLSADGVIGENANITLATHDFGIINTLSMANNGIGYDALDVLTLTESLLTATTACTVRVDTVDGSGNILTWTLLTKGANYSPGTKVVTGGAGTGAQFKITDMDGPWDSQNAQVRIGNMRNSWGTGANDRYGFGLGDYGAGNYLSYNAEGDGLFILKGGDGAVSIDADGITIETGGTTYDWNSIDWVGYADEPILKISAIYDVPAVGKIELGNSSGGYSARNTEMFIRAYSNSSYEGSIEIKAYGKGNTAIMGVTASTTPYAVMNDGTAVVKMQGGDFYTQDFTNYSSSSTGGWSSLGTKKIYYKTFGDWVFVQWELNGTSNSTATTKTFTMPSGFNCNSSIQAEGTHRCDDTGGGPSISMALMPVGGTTIQLFRNAGVGAWAGTGTAWSSGQLWYQRA